MKKLLAFFLLCVCCSTVFAAESVSIILKPQKGISGIVSVNVHADHSMTVLVYESPTNIVESTLPVETTIGQGIIDLSKDVFAQYVGLEDYSQLPDRKRTCAITITRDEVTKSISTRRYTEQLIALLQELNRHLPEGISLPLEAD